MNRRNRIFGWIGIVWGGAVIIQRLLSGRSGGSEPDAYAAGESGALILAGLLAVVGAYFAFRRQ